MSGAHVFTSPLPPRSPVQVGRVRGPGRFRALQGSRVRARSGPIKVTWSAHQVDDGQTGVCVAYAISTAVGNAVQRNTVRRRLRQAIAQQAGVLPPGDLLVRVVSPASECTWSHLTRAVSEVSPRLIAQAMPAGQTS